MTGADGSQIPLGGRVLTFVPEVLSDITYPDAQGPGANVGAGKVPGRADYVFDLNGISRIAYPALWKLGCYRSDYDKATGTGSPNAASTRPYSVLKFSDFYLTAAEAAFKLGNNTDATPATITLDYILDERMREFYGEGFRWFDLARTQTWQERAGSYTISGVNWGDHTPEKFTRNIPDYMYLMPIPKGQLDGMEMSDEEKAAYQNPGYTID